MRIALDVMGGDKAPKEIIKGAVEAAKEWSDIELILVGDELQITPLITEQLANVRVVHADDVITPDDEPVRAVRRKKQSSMVIAGRMVRDGEAEAMISAGNTGALMTTGLLVIGRLPGVERPGLAPMLPTLNGTGVLALDLGANMDATAENLLQYAMMGSIYRQKVDRLERPRVGLLNVGTEENKGNELTKAAFPLLQAAPIDFVGNVESRDIMEGACDVLVCDGFVGNILLKTMEGIAGTIMADLKKEFLRTPFTKLAALIMKPGLKRFRGKMDYREHGGAPFLGIKGVCIKSHGSSDRTAIKNAVRQARTALVNELISSISTEISGK